MNTTKLTTAIELTNAAKNGMSLSEVLYKQPELTGEIKAVLDELHITGADLDTRWEGLLKQVKTIVLKAIRKQLFSWLSGLINRVIGGEDVTRAQIELKYQELKAKRSAA